MPDEQEAPPAIMRLRSLPKRLAYLYELDRSLGLDGGRTPEQERWRRMGPSARQIVREVVSTPDPLAVMEGRRMVPRESVE